MGWFVEWRLCCLCQAVRRCWEKKAHISICMVLTGIVVEWSLVSCLNLLPVWVVTNCLLVRLRPPVNLQALMGHLKLVRLLVVTIVMRVFRNYCRKKGKAEKVVLQDQVPTWRRNNFHVDGTLKLCLLCL